MALVDEIGVFCKYCVDSWDNQHDEFFYRCEKLKGWRRAECCDKKCPIIKLVNRYKYKNHKKTQNQR